MEDTMCHVQINCFCSETATAWWCLLVSITRHLYGVWCMDDGLKFDKKLKERVKAESVVGLTSESARTRR